MRLYCIYLLILTYFTSVHSTGQSLFDDSVAVEQIVNSENVKRNSVYTVNRKRQKPPKHIQIPGSYTINMINDSIQIHYQTPGPPTGAASITFPSDIFLLSGLDKKELTEDFIARVNHPDTLHRPVKDSLATLLERDSLHADTNVSLAYISQLGTTFDSSKIGTTPVEEYPAQILSEFAGSDQNDTLEFTLRTYGFEKITLRASPHRIFSVLPYAPFKTRAGRDDNGAALFLEHELFNFGHMFFIHYEGKKAGKIDCLMYIPIEDIQKTMKTYNPQNEHE